MLRQVFLCLDLVLVLHLPDCWEYGGAFQNLGPEDQQEIPSLELGVHFFHHGSYEFILVGLLHCLVQVHGVWVLGGGEYDGIQEQCLDAEELSLTIQAGMDELSCHCIGQLIDWSVEAPRPLQWWEFL